MAACPPQALLRFPLEAVKQVAMLTVQDHIGIPDPPCSVFPKTQLQSTAPGGGGAASCEAILLPLPCWVFIAFPHQNLPGMLRPATLSANQG